MSKSYGVLIVGAIIPWLSIGIAEIMKLKGVNQPLVDRVVLSGLIIGIIACLYYLAPAKVKKSSENSRRQG